MNIIDKNNRTLAIVTFYKDIVENREFVTDVSEEMQFAKFNLQKGYIVNKHYHQKQERTIYSTAETIIVLDGKIEVSLFEETSNNLVKKIVLESKDSIVMLHGGHSVEILEDAKFVEVKQGPYMENLDKEIF
jgi:hypothetical protein